MGKLVFENEKSQIVIRFLYLIGGYATYEVIVSTNGFMGTCNFCIAEKQLKNYLEIIEQMQKTLIGKIQIEDCESDAYLTLYFESPMQFYVTGQIGGSYEDNMLKFRLKADQTILSTIKTALLDY